jgi:hypothetical protein
MAKSSTWSKRRTNEDLVRGFGDWNFLGTDRCAGPESWTDQVTDLVGVSLLLSVSFCFARYETRTHLLTPVGYILSTSSGCL